MPFVVTSCAFKKACANLHISSLTCFSRQNFRTQLFYRNRYFKNKASVALNSLVSLFGRLVACSGRKRGNNRRTEWQTKYYNPRCACVPRVKNRWNTFGTSHRCLDCILTTLQIHETNYIYIHVCMNEDDDRGHFWMFAVLVMLAVFIEILPVSW